ncbi:MAG: hypothetical protein JXR49_19625 [Acidobacteria bacterium]|nr:hypothetical protein [Acidobacteriota bacterium]
MAFTKPPDTRVRLSAEGTAEVVKAFRKVQAEAERSGKAAKKGASGFGAMGKSLGGVTKLLPALAGGAAIAGLVAMTKRSLEAADSIGKMSQKTGNSVEVLSTLSFGARTAAISQEALDKAMIKLSRTMYDYDSGVILAKDSVQQLFGSSKALMGLDQDTRFLKITQALGKLEPGAKRSGLAMQFFGKAGADLLPLIDDLADDGFEKLREKAERLGLVIDKDLARKSQQALDAMQDMKSAVQGLITRFTAGFAPALADVANTINDAIAGKGVDGFKKLGEIAGNIIKGITAGFLIVGKTIGFVLVEAEKMFQDFGSYIDDAWPSIWTRMKKHASKVATGGIAIGPFVFGGKKEDLFLNDEDKKRMTESLSEFELRLEAFKKEINHTLADLYKPKVPEEEEEEPEDGEDLAADLLKQEQARRAEEALARAKADAASKAAAAELKAHEAAEKEKYEKGLISLREYYANRIKLAEEYGAAEAKALYENLVHLQTAPLGKDELATEREAKVIKAASDYQAKLLDNAAKVKTLRAEEAKEAESLQQKALEFEKKIQEAQGDRFEAARAAIDAESHKLDELLQKQGVAETERLPRVEAFRAAGYQQVDFEQLQDQATRALDELERKRRQIDIQVQSGQLFAYQGEEQIAELEQQRLPLLEQIAEAMKAAAITPEQIQAAEDFQQNIDELAISSNKAALDMASFKQSTESAATSDLSNWLSSGITQAGSLADAFRSAAASIVQSLRQIASQMLANILIQKMLGFLGFSGGGLVKAPVPGQAKAGGGLVRGPGTATSDSIPSLLSNYEYVVRAAVVKQPGMLEHLNSLNFGTPTVRRRTVPRFADGGLVNAPAAGSPRNAALTATLGLDPGLILKALETSPEFDRIIVRTLGNNQKSVRKVIGS